jgi:hypothetical protein
MDPLPNIRVEQRPIAHDRLRLSLFVPLLRRCGCEQMFCVPASQHLHLSANTCAPALAR